MVGADLSPTEAERLEEGVNLGGGQSSKSPCGVAETFQSLRSRLHFVTLYGDVFGISKTQKKAGMKLVARLRANEIDTEAKELARAFMGKHLGEHADDEIWKVQGVQERHEAQEFQTLRVAQ